MRRELLLVARKLRGFAQLDTLWGCGNTFEQSVIIEY